MSVRRWQLLLIVCATLAGCGGGDSVPAPTEPRAYFGVNAQLLQPFPTVGRDGDLAGHARSLAGLGVDFARANLDGRILEPAPPGPSGHIYDFATTDAWVAALAREGLRW